MMMQKQAVTEEAQQGYSQEPASRGCVPRTGMGWQSSWGSNTFPEEGVTWSCHNPLSDNLLPERDRETKVSIHSPIIFSKSLGLGFFGGGSVFQTCRIPEMSQGTKHKSLESRLKPFTPHYDSFPFTSLNTTKAEHFLLHVCTRDQENPTWLSRPPWTQCGNLNQPVLHNCDKPAGVIHNHNQTCSRVELCWISTFYTLPTLLTQGKEIPTSFFIWQFPLGMQFLLLLLLEPCQFRPSKYCACKFRVLYFTIYRFL